MSLPVLIFTLTLVLSFPILLLAMRAGSPSKSMQERLVTIRQPARSRRPDEEGAELEKLEHRDYIVHLGKFLQHYKFSRQLQKLLLHADSAMDIASAALIGIGSAFGGAFVAFLILHKLLIALAGMPVGLLVPYVVLKIKASRRLKAFNVALPDAIDLMARALRAGHSMSSAIEVVAEQSAQPVGGEFFQVFQQQKLGMRLRDALLQMSDRVPSRDLQFLITAILVQKETGGDLTEILDRTSHVIRDRVRIEGEVRTRTAQGRLTGWILGLLPVIMLVLINLVSPGYSTLLFHDPTGQKMLYASGVLIALGGLVIRKVVDVEV